MQELQSNRGGREAERVREALKLDFFFFFFFFGLVDEHGKWCLEWEKIMGVKNGVDKILN